MKNLMITLVLTVTAFIFIGCGSGMVNDTEILGNVKETEKYDALELAKMDENLSNFVDLVELSGLDTSMEFTESFTVFIPTNEAFGKLELARFEELTHPQNRAALVEFIKWHFLPNEVPSMQFDDSQIIQTAGEEEIEISTDMTSNVIYIGGAEIIKADIKTADGIMHVVDEVVRPTADILHD